MVRRAVLGDGSFSLFATSMGIIDYTSRLAADVIKSTYLRARPRPRAASISASSGAGRAGCVILLVGFDQPLPLLVISACIGGVIMFLYSFLLRA